MVSKAREDLPEPESPVTTVRVLRGMLTSRLRRLCWRAPRTVMCVMPMEVVWRWAAKTLEYCIWGEGRYGGIAGGIVRSDSGAGAAWWRGGRKPWVDSAEPVGA